MLASGRLRRSEKEGADADGELDQTYSNLRKAMLCSQMQAGITFVLEIWVPELLRVVANDTLHQRKVVEEDRSTQTAR
jgi:hypothetical protein